MRVLLIAILILLYTSVASALTSVAFGWSASPGSVVPTGYKICYSTTSGVYSTCEDQGLVLYGRVGSLTEGTTYYFVVIAYNVDGDSIPSAQVAVAVTAPTVRTPPPFSTTVIP